ncbi:MAG TPA: type II toxin-antitoxin system HipA family toxin [Pseudobdellovibrionaceae bacterium]|nr:type II toxin-antitoxin system HipA family toxin [Pseudobdellovibrionaceae bacterium]
MKKIEVWANCYFLEEPQKIGVLTASNVRGKEIFSFEYEKSWLKGQSAFQIDPQLQLFTGNFYAAEGIENFGTFLDSSPDRWGRTLMLRREALLAKEEKRGIKSLMPSDYLLGVFDPTRMGALRFKIGDGPFLDDQKNISTPPWTSIRELEQASLFLEQEGSEEDPHFSAQLKLLFAPGSPLGGARPKASVLDENGNLWMAKFPSRDDLKDVGAWESVVYKLAGRCGITVNEVKTQKFANKYHTFLTKRFDRLSGGKRVHFSSAMTLLQYKDGVNHQTGVSYLELADFISANGAPSKVDANLEELWRRIVFSIAVSNSDDHLRNHGFLLSEEGWELSPVYDVNPNEMAEGLSLNISWDSNALDFDLAKSVAQDFRVVSPKANEIIEKIKFEVRNWDKIAESFGISRSERLRMAKAFRV